MAPGVPGIGETVDDEGNIVDVGSGETVVSDEERFDEEPKPDRFEDDEDDDDDGSSTSSPTQSQDDPSQDDSVGAQQEQSGQNNVISELQRREKELEKKRDQLTKGPRGAVAAQDLSEFQDINEELLDVRNEQTEIESGGEPVVLGPDEDLSEDDVARAAQRQAREISDLTGKPVSVSKQVNPEATATSQPDPNDLTQDRFQGRRMSIEPERQETPVPREVLRQLREQRKQEQLELRAGETNPDAPDNTFGTPVSDTLEIFEVEDGGVAGLPSPSDAVETVEEPVSDELGEIVQDVRQIQQGKPAETTREKILETIDDTTRAEGLNGEQSALDVIQSVTETSRDVSQLPDAVKDLVTEGETDAFEQSKEFTPDQTPVVTVGRLAAEEAAFEGGIRLAARATRGTSLLDEAVPSARAADGAQRIRATDGARQSTPFDADQRITVSDKSSTDQARLTGDVEEDVDVGPAQQGQSTGVVETADPEEVLDVRIADRETGETLPLGPDTRLGEQIVSADPERFGQRRVQDTKPGQPQEEQLAEELVGTQPDEDGGVDIRDTLSRLADDTQTRDVQTSLTGDDNQVLQGDANTQAQEVEQATVNVINEQTGRIRSVDEDQALDLLQDDDFRFAGRELSPRERTRVRQARRSRQRRGLDLPSEAQQAEEVQRSLDDEFQQLTTQDTDTTVTAAGDENALDEFLGLDRRGQARLSSPDTQSRAPRDVQDFVDDTQAFRQRDELADEIRQGDDIFPEANSIDDFLEDDFGFTPGTPQTAPIASILQDQSIAGDVNQGQRTRPRQNTDQGIQVDTDTGIRVDEAFRFDEETAQDLRQTGETSQTTRQTTRTLEPTQPRNPDEPPRNRRRPPGAPVPPFTPDLGGQQDQGQADFEAEVRQDGRFVDIGTYPSEEQAVAAAEQAVDNSSARSFRVEEPGGGFADVEPGAKFRESETDEFVVVEETDAAIDTPGEKQDITVQGLLAQQARPTVEQEEFEFGF